MQTKNKASDFELEAKNLYGGVGAALLASVNPYRVREVAGTTATRPGAVR